MNTRRGSYEYWKQFEARGIPLEPPEFRVGVARRCSNRGLVISQQDGPTWAMITELDNRNFGYVLEPFILQTTPRKLIILDCWLSVPWQDPVIEWLPDPATSVPKSLLYSLGTTWQFPREDVLNHRLKGPLSFGDIRQGLLVGRGPMQPPDTYKDGERITVILRVVDQWGQTYSAPFKMRLSRFRPARRPTISKSTRGSLFSRPTPVPPSFVERYRLTREPANGKKDDSRIHSEFVASMASIQGRQSALPPGDGGGRLSRRPTKKTF